MTQVLALLNKKAKLKPELTDMLQRWRDVYYSISLHTTGACPRFRDAATGRLVTPSGYFGAGYQYLFDNYLLSRHPRESDATRHWRMSQYRPLTKAPFGQITEIVTGAIFQDANYTIEMQQPDDNAYIWANNFSGYDVAGYFANIGYRNMVEDPNGIFLRMPCPEHSGDKLHVDIWFINTKDIFLLTGDDFVFNRDGYTWWIDKQSIWRITYNAQQRQYYIASEDKEGYYAHMLNRLPISIAGGEWNTQGYYDSYYSKAKAAADDFVSSYSAAQLVDKEASHPYIVEAATDCIDCLGRGEVQRTCNDCPGGVELVHCGTCGGSGQISRNPGQHIIIPQEQLKDGSPIQIINPDITINAHHRDVCRQIMELITEALHLKKVDEAQSGTAKAIDQERLYKFISTISNHIFDKLIYDTLKDIVAYRNVTVIDGELHPAQYDFTLVKPSQFRIKTSADLLQEYSDATNAGLPLFIRQRMAIDYVDKQYSGDAVMKKKAEILSVLDATGMLDSGKQSPENISRSQQLLKQLDELINNKGARWFVMADIKAVEAALVNG
ncbi:MAG: hypothetical protein EOP51_04055 [Sphingobacteriales bacterium]|nr:MAG: hypothetical protein EOP51_04055 [Sphingobacteriales bacterium]